MDNPFPKVPIAVGVSVMLGVAGYGLAVTGRWGQLDFVVVYLAAGSCVGVVAGALAAVALSLWRWLVSSRRKPSVHP